MKLTENISENFESFLNRPLFGYQETYVIIGSFFEELTKELFGKYAIRLGTDPSADVCPDLCEPTKREFFIESKAAGRRKVNKSNYKRAEWKMKISGRDNYNSFFSSYFPSCLIDKPDFNPVLLYAFWSYDIGSQVVGDFDNSSKLIKALTYSDMKLYLVDSFILGKMFELKTLSDVPSMGEMYRMRDSEFKLLNDDKWVEFSSKWQLPIEDCFYTSCEKSGLEINKKRVNSFPVRALLSKHSYSKESVANFLENNILGGN